MPIRRTLGRKHASRAPRADTAVAYPARFGWRSFIAYPFYGDVLANARHGAAVDSPFEYRLAWLCRSSCPVPSHAVITVADDGPAIAEHDLARSAGTEAGIWRVKGSELPMRGT
jgi:hypothetical protein